MASTLDDHINSLENHASGRPHADLLEPDRHGTRFRFGGAVERRDLLGWTSERLQQPRGNVAMGRILASEQCDFLAEQRQVEGPVDEEQGAASVAGPPEIGHQQPHREREAAQCLRSFDDYDHPLEREAGRCPLEEQALVLAAQGALGAVGTNRHEPEKRFQIESAQRPAVVPLTEVALSEQILRAKGHAESDHRR